MACVIVSALRSCAGEQRFVSCCVLRVLSAASCTYWLSKIKVAEFDMASWHSSNILIVRSGAKGCAFESTQRLSYLSILINCYEMINGRLSASK